MRNKIVIIGGVAAGASFATRYRRLNEKDEIIMFEKGEYVSFANCGLPYHISGVIKDRSKLIVETVSNLKSNFNLDVRNFSEVISIDSSNKKVLVKEVLTNKTYYESFDKLIIATGAKPLRPNIEGINSAENIFSLRNINDMDSIINYIKEKNVKNASVIGGGFIGLEVMENLKKLKLNVTLIEQSKQVMQTFDYELAQLIHNQIIDNDVNLILNDGVKRFEENGKVIILNSNKKIKTDLTILAIGVRPDNTVCNNSKIKLTEKGYIDVDHNFETNIKDIYAIGDVIEIENIVAKEKMPIALASPANKQGRVLANKLNGINDFYKGSVGTSITEVFKLVIATTGLNEKYLKRLNKDYKTIIIHPNNHADYYPNAKPITLKVLFNKKTEEIYGAQAIGYEGVDKRIDIISVAIQTKMKITELKDLELAYAPPFSNAKDPVNMIGFIAENIINDLVSFIDLNDFRKKHLNEKDAIFLDIRNEKEYLKENLPNSINIPISKLRENLSTLDKSKKIYVYCLVGQRSYNAVRILKQNGFDAYGLKGGLKAYNCIYDNNGFEICYTNPTDMGRAKK